MRYLMLSLILLVAMASCSTLTQVPQTFYDQSIALQHLEVSTYRDRYRIYETRRRQGLPVTPQEAQALTDAQSRYDRYEAAYHLPWRMLEPLPRLTLEAEVDQQLDKP